MRKISLTAQGDRLILSQGMALASSSEFGVSMGGTNGVNTNLHYSCNVNVSPVKGWLSAILGFNALREWLQE